LFFENKKSDKLLVVFSAMVGEGQSPVYNYVIKFNNIKCNKLYILDEYGYQKRGSYYLGENNNFFIDKAVTKLIDFISNEHGFNRKNIITTGTSKGGFAALYFR